MKAVITDTKQEAIDLKFAIFDEGAPFTAQIYSDHWDEETKCVMSAVTMKGCTDSLESEFEHDGKWALKHIDEYVFHPYTYQYYMDTYPDNVAIQSRIPRDDEGDLIPEWLEKTPQMWVSEVIIGDNYTVEDIVLISEDEDE
ncbi:MAG: hypothetical protein GY777_10565 [Candidatus Brocadiaceae bacterium]|jgi:hypothetical protein|nr:hypothetical protein [Candidatus Brocadiaceae bacterium]